MQSGDGPAVELLNFFPVSLNRHGSGYRPGVQNIVVYMLAVIPTHHTIFNESTNEGRVINL